jgi:hypothetical protein
LSHTASEKPPNFDPKRMVAKSEAAQEFSWCDQAKVQTETQPGRIPPWRQQKTPSQGRGSHR